MDWADDIAYSVHDFEDAIHAGHLPLDALHDPVERKALLDLTQQRYAPSFEWAELEEALDRLLALPYWPRDYDESHRAMAVAQEHHERADRSVLPGGRGVRLGRRAATARLRRYQADLVVPGGVRAECAVLKAITAQYVMLRKGAPERYAQQREIVTELTHLLMLGAPSTLEPMFAEWFGQAADDAGRLAGRDRPGGVADRYGGAGDVRQAALAVTIEMRRVDAEVVRPLRHAVLRPGAEPERVGVSRR